MYNISHLYTLTPTEVMVDKARMLEAESRSNELEQRVSTVSSFCIHMYNTICIHTYIRVAVILPVVQLTACTLCLHSHRILSIECSRLL